MTAISGIVFENGIRIEDTEHGLLVRQGGLAYVARNWRVAPPTLELFQAAIEAGLPWVIRDQHPAPAARWPNTRGRVHLSFSPSFTGLWSIAVDSFDPKRMDYGKAAFHGNYRQQFVERGIAFAFEKRNTGAGHMEVAREHVLPVLRMLRDFDHSVLNRQHGPRIGKGFIVESELQHALITQWHTTELGRRSKIHQEEYRVDIAISPRRIDILARLHDESGWIVVEIKRHEASIDAVRQVLDYMMALERGDRPLPGTLHGALVAERIPDRVREAARRAGIEAYEAAYPFALRRVV